MNKILIKFLLVIYGSALLSCSYTPIFSEKNYNFGIENISFAEKSEKDVNKIIKSRFDLIQQVNDKKLKKYSIFVETSKIREVVSKDSKGDPVKFELIISANYTILENKEEILERSIERKNIYDNNSDKFKLEQNEKIIIENLSSNISEIILTSIVTLDDN